MSLMRRRFGRVSCDAGTQAFPQTPNFETNLACFSCYRGEAAAKRKAEAKGKPKAKKAKGGEVKAETPEEPTPSAVGPGGWDDDDEP